MPDGNDYGEPKGQGARGGTQAIANESWPLSDKAGGHARGIEDQPEPIDVEVRIEWADDGEEWLPGRAHRWTSSHVFVRFQDVAVVDGVCVGSGSGCAASLSRHERTPHDRAVLGSRARPLGRDE